VPKSSRSANPLNSARAYEELIYSLPDSFPSIQFSTLVLVHTSIDTARIEGDLHFANDVVLRALQFVDFREKTIRQYSYELYQRGEKIWWYDPWPHPQEKSLASTRPHHKHVGPGIKRNRVPAPGLSFERPNLPFLIREIEILLADSSLL
jgi:hypothetical protein